MREKGWIPFRWLALWWFLMFLGDLVFYVVLTPIWLGLRAAAWAAELRSRVGRSLRKSVDLALASAAGRGRKRASSDRVAASAPADSGAARTG